MSTCFMSSNAAFGRKSQFTLITRVNKHVGEMMGLHMVPSTVAGLVRKLVAEHTMVL